MGTSDLVPSGKGRRNLSACLEEYYKLNDPGILHASDGFDVIVDTGASQSVSFDKKDFVDGEIEPLSGVSMSGIASSLEVKGVGTIKWVVYDDSGQTRTIQTRGYYIPTMKARLFSPQSYLQNYQKDGEFMVKANEAKLKWRGSSCLTMAYQRPSMLPVLRAFHESSLQDSQGRLMACVTEESNNNLTRSQKDLLRWHFRLGHLCFS